MAISGINSGVPSSVYQTNMQQVGGQASVANKKDLAPAETESNASALSDEVTLTGDQVDDATDAFANASHVGLLGEAADEDGTDVSDDTEVPSETDMPGDSEIPGEPGVPVGGDEVGDEVGAPDDAPPAGVPSDGGDEVGAPGDAPRTDGPGEAGSAKPSREDMMADMKKAQEEREAWEKFMMEQTAQHQKHMAELLKILQDLQDFMFTTMQEVAKNQADAGHRCAMMWDDCIRGPR